MATINIGYLIPVLRLTIGDTNPSSYRYVDEWLLIALKASIFSLGRWWGDRNKYLVDDSNLVSRNTAISFLDAEPPVILPEDEQPIYLLAAILVLEGSLENSSWDYISWKDNEISFSNLESSRSRDRNLDRLWNQLLALMVPPSKKLAKARKSSLPGYLRSPYERSLTEP